MGATWGDLNTMGACNLSKGNLGTYGGYNAGCHTPSNAAVSMGTSFAQSDAIWFMAGHGNTGFITTVNSTYGSTVLNVSGSVPGSSCSSPNACLTSYTSTQMHDIRLMVFEGCHTGSAISNGDTLPKRAYNNLGVDSSVGFSALIYFPQGDRWANIFTFELTNVGYRYSVSGSAWDAANSVYNYYGSYWGYDSLVMYGSGTKIYPAAYGS